MFSMFSTNSWLTYNPLFVAYSTHYLLYPFPLNRIFLVSYNNSSVIFSIDFPSSSLFITYLIASAIDAATTDIGKQTFCEEPTALNSNLFPV